MRLPVVKLLILFEVANFAHKLGYIIFLLLFLLLLRENDFDIAPDFGAKLFVDPMSQLIKGYKFLALTQLKDFWGFKFKDNIKFLAWIDILVEKVLSLSKDRAIHENQAGILGPRVLPIV
jgi:hypothetical protein